MKKILVLAYYFPPMAFSGVQRIAKFTKYLPDFGFQPTVLTIDPHAYFAFDDELLAELSERNIEIWRTSPGGPHALMPKKKTVSFGNERMRKFLNRVSQAVYIPDNKVGWGKHVLEFLQSKDMSDFDAILCTGPPFSLFTTGVEIKRRTGLPLVLDFRDAWLEYPYHRYITPWHKHRHRQLEQEAVENADVVVTTNDYVALSLEQRHDASHARFATVTQGFDPDDFSSCTAVDLDNNKQHVVHTGLFYEDRTPAGLFQVIKHVMEEHAGKVAGKILHFHFVGAMQREFQEMAQQMGIQHAVTFHGHVSHKQSVGFLKAADALWFNIGSADAGFETVAPGKVYEYIGSRKPILGVTPENHVSAMLATIANAKVVRPHELTDAAEILVDESFYTENPTEPSEFTRRHQTGVLADSIRLTLS